MQSRSWLLILPVRSRRCCGVTISGPRMMQAFLRWEIFVCLLFQILWQVRSRGLFREPSSGAWFWDRLCRWLQSCAQILLPAAASLQSCPVPCLSSFYPSPRCQSPSSLQSSCIHWIPCTVNLPLVGGLAAYFASIAVILFFSAVPRRTASILALERPRRSL